ncbi:MAG: N-formylglutamate amidohydrolase [Roseobacter sp.]
MTDTQEIQSDTVAEVTNAAGLSDIVLVCEHASNFIPTALDNLGLDDIARTSHAAWDPGAQGVACEMSRILDAPLVSSCVSRLVYDCNRPPSAVDAMPARSEVFDIPGNQELSQAERETRTALYYDPFRAKLTHSLLQKKNAIVVTIHSFTPVYNGVSRAVEIGILHDTDKRLADGIIDVAQGRTSHIVRRNEPYGPGDGVTHTLQEHALPQSRLNVMVEIRNDLIQSAESQKTMADLLSNWITQAVKTLESTACRS